MTAILASQATLRYNRNTKDVFARAVLDIPSGVTIERIGFNRMDSIPQKRCSKCKEWKPATLEFFNAHKDCRFGVNSVCRRCQSLRTTPLPEPAPEGYKKCYSCKEVKPLSEFYKNRARRDGHHTACKACAKISDHAVTDRRSKRNEAIVQKQCLRCEQIKAIADFPRDRNGYYRNVCKACRNKERSLRIPGQINIPEEKRCPWCKHVKLIKEFNLNPRRKDGHNTYCRDCDGLRRQLKGTAQNRLPLSREQYNHMLQEQDGKCAICHTHTTRRPLHIDHDHQTGQIRDLLCSKCNSALGMLKEDPELIKALLAYVEKWKGQT